MVDCFVGEIRMFPVVSIPLYWQACDGQLLSIGQNSALFSLLGTTFGGNGMTTFALPDLRGAAAMGFGGGYDLGTKGGEATHALALAEQPSHDHDCQAGYSAANSVVPAGNMLGNAVGLYDPNYNVGPAIHPDTLKSVGNGEPHENMQPYTAFCFCIATQGLFPSSA